ncbi:class I SAM-dependent rRNA methyltransferase [Alloacidobacterium dinghuense]|uniref:Class I SAM-dependent rRNA methyltransferase n=1 Tax=Alloacidobacterium dinghuense TaxID=2763107 RepID=A0A7G8BH88_9BACT|nr:class I SAM-dependent rRNA methyltransferase [Alloacidobacterium dinghuense]QNI31908.1 class I SAM-dependent rRNA methyltransferase [Alloacidobacterium dinghuense]
MPARKTEKHTKRNQAARSTSATAPPVEFNGSVAIISRRAADRIRAGHVWVYQSDMESVEGEPSGLVAVADHRGIPLGTALYSPASQITLRLVSASLIDWKQWLDLVRARLQSAIRLRLSMLSAQTNACRLVFSEADALPGLIADKYGELVILQLLTKPLDNDEIRTLATDVLHEELAPATIVERPDPRIRELEQLSAPSATPLYAAEEEHPLLSTDFRLNGLTFHYDATAGQKTGAFLDQRENYAAAARYAHGEALDVCTYQGGFALHLARSCPRVTGVDVSRTALEVAEKNLAANAAQLHASNVDWMEANAFDLLRDWSASGAVYDTIVLDPPAFAKSKRAVEGALRGYKELNLRAMKMLRPGGTLVTCSCSHHVSLADFQQVVATAAGDTGRRVRLIERRGAAADHPAILTIPETEYLKCLICSVE